MKNLVIIFISFLAISLQAQTYKNPILTPGTYGGNNIGTLADPFVLKDDDGMYYMYVTGAGYPCFSSKDLVNWKFEGRVFPKKNRKWAERHFWAPEVTKYKDKYYLHYSASRQDNIKKVGVAVSDSPTGPFTDVDDKPLLDFGDRGAIDSHVFADDNGRTYMYYTYALDSAPELDGIKISEVWVVEVAPDLSKVISEPKMLFYPQQEWEFKPNKKMYWNEGPFMVKHKGTYYLMYSANCFCNETYALGYATSKSPMGPFVKYSGNPILSNFSMRGDISGTGHHSVTKSPDGKEWIVMYHSHVHIGNLNESNHGIRQINIDRMEFQRDGSIKILGPTVSPQPYPSNKVTKKCKKK